MLGPALCLRSDSVGPGTGQGSRNGPSDESRGESRDGSRGDSCDGSRDGSGHRSGAPERLAGVGQR